MKTNGVGGLLYVCHKNSPRCSITDLDGWNTVRVCIGIFSSGLTQTHVLSLTDSLLKTIVTLNEVVGGGEAKKEGKDTANHLGKEEGLVSRLATGNMNKIYLVPFYLSES
jgi:hypothetical protein